MRRPALALSLLALAALGACGGNDVEEAREAATRYVSELGQRDGEGTCAQMTDELQKEYARAASGLNPQLAGADCGRVMQVQLNSVPPDQLRRFADAEITDVKIDGDEGTFRYRVAPSAGLPSEINVLGRVAKEDGDWKVSCCVPGQRSG
jgi:hypothetical protein